VGIDLIDHLLLILVLMLSCYQKIAGFCMLMAAHFYMLERLVCMESHKKQFLTSGCLFIVSFYVKILCQHT